MGTVLPKRQAQAILDKLGAAPGEVAVDLSSFDPKGLSRLVEGLTTAIRENRLVRFTYASPQGIGPRAAEPCRLFYRLSAWYLLAYCRQRQDFRTFKLARITGLKVLEERFRPREVPEGKLDFREYFAGEGWTLRALFDPRAAWRLIEEYGEGAFVPQADGGLLLERRFVSWENLLAWVLSFGEDVQVLEPPELREELRRQGEKLAERYK